MHNLERILHVAVAEPEACSAYPNASRTVSSRSRYAGRHAGVDDRTPPPQPDE